MLECWGTSSVTSSGSGLLLIVTGKRKEKHSSDLSGANKRLAETAYPYPPEERAS